MLIYPQVRDFLESERTLGRHQEWSEVDSLDVSGDQGPCFLYEQSKNTQPLYASNEEALSAVNKELEGYAQRFECALDELVKMADEALEYNEDYNRVLSLAKQIAFLKR